MRAAVLAGLLLASGLASQEQPADLAGLLQAARAELAALQEESRKDEALRHEQRQALLTRLLALEQEERQASARLEESRKLREAAASAAASAAAEAKSQESARTALERSLRQAAGALVERTHGSLAGHGEPEIVAARNKLKDLLAQAGQPFPPAPLLQAALDLAFREAHAGTRVARVRARLALGPQGPVQEVELLRIGLIAAGGPAGVIVAEPALDRFRLVAVPDLPAGLDGPGPHPLPLDLTGGLALASLDTGKDLAALIQAGGPVMYPLFALGGLGLLLALLRTIALLAERRSLKRLGRELPALLDRKDRDGALRLCRSRGGAVSAALASCLEAAGQPRAQAERLLDQALLQGEIALERFLGTLAVLGTLAPFLGLLGTVTGMISTFNALTATGGRDSSVLAGGIAEALITTQTGLVMAIPLVLLHSLLASRAERAGAALEELATRVALAGEER